MNIDLSGLTNDRTHRSSKLISKTRIDRVLIGVQSSGHDAEIRDRKDNGMFRTQQVYRTIRLPHGSRKDHSVQMDPDSSSNTSNTLVKKKTRLTPGTVSVYGPCTTTRLETTGRAGPKIMQQNSTLHVMNDEGSRKQTLRVTGIQNSADTIQ